MKKTIDFEEKIEEFWKYLKEDNIEIYNEFSLQFELGIFLRKILSEDGYKVQFERNVTFFDIKKTETTKHEMDIVVFNGDSPKNCTEKYAIELKYPRNGQYPEQMYNFVKDIVFMEELKAQGFDDTYVITVVDDSKFYNGKCEKNDEIYKLFRCSQNHEISGEIKKPTGKGKEKVSLKIKGTYKVAWKDIGVKSDRGNPLKYYLLKIKI